MKNICVLVMIAILISNELTQAQSCKAYEVPSTQITNLSHFTDFQSLKLYQVNYFRNNQAGFCERNLKIRFLKANHLINSQQCISMSNADLESLVVPNFQKDKSIWSYSLMPKFSYKVMAFSLGHIDINNYETFNFYPQLTTKEFKKAHFDHLNKIIDKYSYQTFAAQSAASDLKIKAFCSMEKLMGLSQCTEILAWIRDIFAPRGRGVDIIDVALWRRVVASDIYDRGLMNTLELIHNRSVYQGSENIFDDLKNSFLQSGLSQQKAEQGAWDILAFISNQGASIGTHMSMIDNKDENKDISGGIKLSPKAKVLTQIAAHMVLQDYQNNQNKLPLYSYPANVKTSCDSYKPYHFWMSAYIARSVMQNFKVDAQTAAAAAFMTEKGYQIHRDIAGDGAKQNKVTSVFRYSAFDPVHQMIRVDLAYAAVGAQYGALSVFGNRNKIYDFGKSMDALMRYSGEMILEEQAKEIAPKQGLFIKISNYFGGYPERLNNYIQWNSIFQADQAFYALTW